MRRSMLLLSLVFGIALLAGCGNKGPLVLPSTRPAPSPAGGPAPATPATAASTMPAASRP